MLWKRFRSIVGVLLAKFSLYSICLSVCGHRLNFSICDVILHNLHALDLFFMLNKNFLVKNSVKMKNSSFL